MRYLAVMRECFECDNNTPGDKVWATIVELKDEREKRQAEKTFLTEILDDSAVGGSVDFIPLDALEKGWEKVAEIW